LRIPGRCLRDIPRLTNELTYFANILKALETGDEEQCPICLEAFEVGANLIGLTPCGHAFCIQCLNQLGHAPCPTCRNPISPNTVMSIKLNPEAKNDVLLETFGSKIHQLVLYMVAQLSVDSTFKFIIFVQFSKLARLTTEALLQHEINSVNLAGTVESRKRALAKFEKKEFPVLVMSAEQSVAGINITTASHVIIFHPFCLGSDDESVAAEEQGIARACRLGQTR